MSETLVDKLNRVKTSIYAVVPKTETGMSYEDVIGIIDQAVDHVVELEAELEDKGNRLAAIEFQVLMCSGHCYLPYGWKPNSTDIEELNTKLIVDNVKLREQIEASFELHNAQCELDWAMRVDNTKPNTSVGAAAERHGKARERLEELGIDTTAFLQYKPPISTEDCDEHDVHIVPRSWGEK